jgi:secreted trypsin-like serine protease
VVTYATVGRYYHDGSNNDQGKTYNITKRIMHPKYNNYTMNFDFLLVQINGTSSNPTLRLNYDSSAPALDQEFVVAGFGDTDPGATLELPNTLQFTRVDAFSTDACERVKAAGGISLDGLISPMQMCAFRRDHDACQGDSGGPLILQGDNSETDVQVGIVSWYVHKSRICNYRSAFIPQLKLIIFCMTGV